MLLTASILATTLTAAQMPVHAQTTDTTTSTTKKKSSKKPVEHKETVEERQIRELKESMKLQQEQIDALKQQLSGKDAAVSSAAETAGAAQAQAQQAAAAAAAAQASADAAAAQAKSISSSVADVKTTTAGLTQTVLDTQTKVQEEINSPTTLHYKGITISPVAFAAFEGVWRQHSVNSDINTPLNSIPFPSANEGHVSELNLSGRQSRLGVQFQGDAGNYKLTGYYEMDFLGTGTSSNNNQSNSYVLRQRQIWAQAALKSGFTVTGGQMWSLVTEDRKGTDARSEIQPQTIDPQYLVGYSWTRQPGIRIQQKFGDYKTGAFTIAAAAEQGQITNFTASNLPTNPANAVGTSTSILQFFFAGTGQNGGLYNAAAGAPGNNNANTTTAITTYANNVVPDFIVKAAVDYPMFHFEIGGIARFLRDYYFPITYSGTAASPTYSFGGPAATSSPTVAEQEISNTATAGGAFASARVYLGKFAEVALQGMVGTGTGRYGSSQLADATLKPNETLEPIKNYHALFSDEMHITKKLDAFVYYGGEYAQRTTYTLPITGVLIGYGPRTLNDSGCYANPSNAGSNASGGGGSISATGSCASPTRYIQEAMGGLTYKAINSPKYGRLQYSLTYSYIQRNLWSGYGGQPSATTPSGPRATEPMIHIQMRYYIP
jgi:hypothetical protein